MRKLSTLALLLALAVPAVAQQKPIAYPAKGQSQSQQAKDDGECVAWANQQTAGAQFMRSGMPGETAYIPGNQFIIGRRSGCALWNWASC